MAAFLRQIVRALNEITPTGLGALALLVALVAFIGLLRMS
jgi:hypothetical protein